MFHRSLIGCWLALAGSLELVAAALSWQQLEGHRRAPLVVPSAGKAGFTEISPAISGINFTNLLSEEKSLTNQIFLNGSGVAAGDIDGDGLCDLYFCGLDSRNALYRNLGRWRFADITATAGVSCAGQASTGATFADIDGDGNLDLLVNGIARGTRLFLNDGQGKFREATETSGLRGGSGSMSMALADIDRDGLLDLYVVNYRNDTMRDMPDPRFNLRVTNGVYQLLSFNGQPATTPGLANRFTFDRAGGVLENGEADVLYRNAGNGRFVPVSWTNGAFLDERGMPARTPYDWGLSAMFRDINGDGAPDLYVCNDFQSPDRIWINDGRGRFRALARPAIRQTSLFSMGVDFADVDRDGHDDFFVADMLSREHARRQVQVMDAVAFAQVRNTSDDRPQSPRNTLFRNRGNGAYAEVARLAGLDASDWSWCPAFLDVDLDGYEDLLVTTGHWRDLQHADIAREIDELKKNLSAIDQLRLRKRFPRLDTPNAAFRNRGDLTFEDTRSVWGFDSRQTSHGMALADLDNDGDLDAIIHCLNDPPLVYRNDSSAPRVAVCLRGLPPNTRGVGAKVRVLTPALPAQSQEFICGGRYLSSDDFVRSFAAGNATNRLTIEVTWRNGRRSMITNAPANHVFELDESVALIAKPRDLDSETTPFFEDVSHLLGHQHVDEPFDDFARQPLLPRKFSDLGPGVTWCDFNGDGWDDLFIGAGRGGRLGVFRNDGQGRFVRQRAKAFEVPAEQDLTTVLGWRRNATNLVLLLGLANYEAGATNGPSVREFSVVTGTANEDLLRSASSTGPLALADIDQDGDLDLFVGSRVIAGRYPEPASSAMLRNESGHLRFDVDASRPLANIGLVSGALFADLTGDGWPELVLACEWGPLRIFRNERGKLVAWDVPLSGQSPGSSSIEQPTLAEFTGWWNSVAGGDFDGDGRLDLVAGNWGRNTSRQRFLSKPLHLYFGATRGAAGLALVEAYYDSASRKLVPARDWGALGAVFPRLRERFPNFATFSAAAIPEILDAGLLSMNGMSVASLDSVVLLNRGEHFDVRRLPVEAQFSPVFGIAAGELDGDGDQDLFLAQNFFGVAASESRLDAGCGLWLRGDGRGNFAASSPAESGFEIGGEARGVALADFNHDGRLDIAVGQNRDATKLYRNIRAEPGLRVHLEGSRENPHAVGAIIRPVFRGGSMGPTHEIRLGAGYWSQDSTDIIVGRVKDIEALEIRWPGGVIERVSVPAESPTILRRAPNVAGRP
ncbi:MAG: hypothetical protein FJ403_02450 [Verrucomicrobia bacterium]|nr:hypothetical protein [Verrucomicrobiota bacterium]